ncbi:MAG: multidrug efflux system outer membrane protein, partial [Rhodothermales bacterium]
TRTEMPPMTAWWEQFGDPVLNTVVDSALAQNRDLRIAAARVVEVQQQYRIARAALLPTAGVGGEVSRTDSPSNTGFSRNIGASVPGFPSRFVNENYSISGTLSYELDLWGRVRGEKNASLSTFLATESELHGVRIGVVAQTIATYLELRATQEQLNLARENVDLLSERVDLTQDRYERGISASFELYAIRQEFQNTRTTVPLLEASLADAEGRLAVLLGTFSAEIRPLLAGNSGQEVILGDIPSGLPADLLENRPDIAAAIHRVRASSQSVGAARARLLPTVSLTAVGGVQSAELSELLDLGQTFSNLVGSLTAPLFRGGALRAGVEGSEARLTQAVAQFEQTLLNAFREVEVTLISFSKQKQRLAFLNEEQRFAEASLQTASNRYLRGIGDYVSLLDAHRNHIRVQTSLVLARRDVANARLAVHRALGGAWVANPDATP